MDLKTEIFDTDDVLAACRGLITADDLRNWRRLGYFKMYDSEPGSPGKSYEYDLFHVYAVVIILNAVSRGSSIKLSAAALNRRVQSLHSDLTGGSGWTGEIRGNVAKNLPIDITDRNTDHPWFWVIGVSATPQQGTRKWQPSIEGVRVSNDANDIYEALLISKEGRYEVWNITEFLKGVDKILTDRVKARQPK